MAKQLGKFNFLMELELQNVPHHPEIAAGRWEESEQADGEEATESDLSGEGQVAVENAWMEYNHNRFLSVRVGKQLSPQYWWQNHYPNLTLSTAASYLPPRVVPGGTGRRDGARVGGASRSARRSSASATSSTSPTTTSRATAAPTCSDGKSWGARGQVRFPTKGALAALRRGGRYVSRHGRARRTRSSPKTTSSGSNRSSRSRSSSCRPSGRAASRWGRRAPAITCSRRTGSTKTGSRSIASSSSRAREFSVPSGGTWRGVNFRPYPQIAFKGELYRSQPLERDFIHAGGRRRQQAVQRVRDGGGVLLLNAVVRRFLTAALIVLMWTGHASTQIIPFVVIVNNANPVKSLTHGRAAAHLHEAVAHVAARRADGAGRLG